MERAPTIALARDDRLVAAFAALAIAIHVLETVVPSPLPGIKPGMANVVTLVVMLRYGWRMAAWVALLRVLAGSLIIGTFLTPTFMLSLSGALASLGALGLAWLALRRWLGGVGYGVISALAHVAGQVGVAFAVFVPHPAILALLPILMTMALLLGLVSGTICNVVINALREHPA
ncbi:MAG: Gx transporter family protein [Gammaproteobacteria bacterium]|jgi:heptaprenyl diphosphate synthase